MQKKDRGNILSGTVEDIVYRNEQNDYTVIDVATDDNMLYTAVGILPYVCEGETVRLFGSWIKHDDYGKQFSVESYEKELPKDNDAMCKFLSSKQVKGIGPATALKLVSKYGKDTFDVIEKHPEWLADIPGITMQKAAQISKSFAELSGVREVMMICQGDIGVQSANKIYKALGDSAVGIIREHPYRLVYEVEGISFEKADALAKSVGLSTDSSERTSCALYCTLKIAMNSSGHTCLPRDELVLRTSSEYGIEKEIVSKEIDKAILDKALYRVKNTKDYIYIPTAYFAEKYVAKKLAALEKATVSMANEDVRILTDKVESTLGIEYSDMQRKAIFESMQRGVLIITGGPGTGKTTIVRAILSMCKNIGQKTVLCAPTGRAAKRMSEATSEEAMTIHRMLEMVKTSTGESVFMRNEKNTLDQKVIILDEASMIDIFLAEALLKATKNGTKLIIIGDADQLPSVGCGNFLRDIISCGEFTTVELDKVFRQSGESLIIDNAHRINHDEMPILDEKKKDFFFMQRDEQYIGSTVLSLVTERLPKSYGKDILHDIQVITPSKKGVGGTDVLNPMFREKLNPKDICKTEIKSANRVFREGDRIMQIRNNYDVEWEKGKMIGTGVFNGEIGIISEIDKKRERATLIFDDKTAEYDFAMLEDIDLSYAITVHKSQGSEYPIVIIPVYSAPEMLLTRNMIYTAITRARTMVILVGSKEVLKKMVDNSKEEVRYTNLLMAIKENMKSY